MAKKSPSKKVSKEPRRVVLGVGHPLFGRARGATLGYQTITLLEGDMISPACMLEIGNLGAYNKIRLVAEVIS